MSTDALAIGIGDLVGIEWGGCRHNATVIGVGLEGRWVVLFDTLVGMQMKMAHSSHLALIESASARATALASTDGEEK